MNHSPSKKIRVKLIHRGQPGFQWISQFPDRKPSWGDCEFLMELEEHEYDWLVVIDDISRGFKSSPEKLACADRHTILVTTEPPTITRYGSAFTRQFEHVLTSQDEKSLPHPNRIHSHTGNLWFNGHDFDGIQGIDFSIKDRTISTVCSSKQQKHTIHNDRYEFTQRLKLELPQLDVFGHGVQFIEHKYDALDRYKFHLAIENHAAPHHWTEKIADPFLSGAIPIYYGCTNIEEYFPADSYLPIDINKPEEAMDSIRNLISDPQSYTSRLEALREAQRLVLHEYNLMSMLADFISTHFNASHRESSRLLYGRKQMRARNPCDLFQHIMWQCKKTHSR